MPTVASLALLLTGGCGLSVLPSVPTAPPPLGHGPGSQPSRGEPSSWQDPLPLELRAEPLPGCEAPVESPGALRDGLEGAGIDFVHQSDIAAGLELGRSRNGLPSIGAAGVVAADFDGDEWPDLYLTQTVGPNALYLNQRDGTFARVERHGAEMSHQLTLSASAVDFDGDGDQDLSVAGWYDLALLQNRGDGTFVRYGHKRGFLPPEDGSTAGVAWADYDSDGDLDAYVAGYLLEADPMAGWAVPLRDLFYRNDDGFFTDIMETLPRPNRTGALLDLAWHDLDNDGDPDLVRVADLAPLAGYSEVLENVGPSEDGWVFESRIQGSGLGPLPTPMGVSVRDFNGDGLWDMWFTDVATTNLFQGVEPWGWANTSFTWSYGVERRTGDVTWSIVDLDLDGNGQAGLFLTLGPLPEGLAGSSNTRGGQEDWFLEDRGNPGSPAFDEAPEVFPRPPDGSGRGVALADFNRDGVPDLLVGNIDGPPDLWLGACTENNRLVVEIRDERAQNIFGVGTRISVETRAGTQVQEVTAGSRGSLSGSEPIVFFGLGEQRGVDRLTVRWTDGRTDVFEGVCAQCRVRVTRRAD